MPHLLNFIKDNGTLDTNDHTVLISHTGGGILELADRASIPTGTGRPSRTAYGYFRPRRLGRLLVHVQVLDGQHRRRQPGEQPADAVRRTRTTTWSTTTRRRSAARGAVRNAPAPWVPYTRAGCDVGGVGLANIELENNNVDHPPRTPAHRRSRPPPPAGDDEHQGRAASTASRPGRRSCSRTRRRAPSSPRSRASAPPAPAGTGVDLTAPLAKAHNERRRVHRLRRRSRPAT